MPCHAHRDCYCHFDADCYGNKVTPDCNTFPDPHTDGASDADAEPDSPTYGYSETEPHSNAGAERVPC